MASYKGEFCPVCHKAFADGDQIVVCPECGTPHHRDCYFQLGHCANAERHGEDFAWQPEKQAPAAAPGIEGGAAPGQEGDGFSRPCPHCHAANPPGALFCVSCGKPLESQQQQYAAGPGFGPMAANQQNIKYGGVNPEDTIDGIRVEDMAEFIGPSSGYYLYQFKNMDLRGRKLSFSWSGFFITPLYMLFRKVWPVALLSILLNITLNIPGIIFFLTPESQINTLLTGPFAMAYTVTSLLMMAVQIFFGLFANAIYRRSVVKKIKQIQAMGLDRTETLRLYHKKGGVCRWAVLAVGLLLMVSSLLGTLLTAAGL
ncbi:RING finger protein [Bittarella massiliensis (ex Durand et al. 2017)]|uniref:RING finger protein n=1 Tax=Bittarella massiliensis (ex Durand et al. 2017) TaxID=1720313 RepID=UPI001AA1D113|nr:RING finger protein [Bittarella massiliensis (ex Durand et al. 2017)]MBO1680080.1 DUF2628 domain-containing protein [Bittarella massiliensis (ex Durand et al. 2017)]